MWRADGYEVNIYFNIVNFVHKLTIVTSRREAFETENFVWQARKMDAIISGLERALVGFT